MAGLCRFCAKSESGIDVFSEAGHKINLYSKIKLCLPINITVNDGITTLICFSCIAKLNITYEFHTTCVSVQYQLRNLMEAQEKERKCTQTPSNIEKDVSYPNPSEETPQITAINTNGETPNCENTDKTDDDWGFKIESVKSISQKVFQAISDSTEIRENGKRSLEISDEQPTPDTAKKKDRMTVCQYCRKWFPRSIIIHHEKLHVKGGITFNCTLCNKDFQEADDFENHYCTGNDD